MANAADEVLNVFQSSPDPEAGRNTITRMVRNEATVFQSSPDPEAGRNVSHPRTSFAIIVFQSSPDPEAGRNGDDDTLLCQRVLRGICAGVTFPLYEIVC